MAGSASAADAITKLIGDFSHRDHVKNLLEEVGNGDDEKSEIARSTLLSMPNVSVELLATMTVAVKLDESIRTANSNTRAIRELKREHDAIHGPESKGCSALKLGFERMEKMFFRGVCICLGVPTFLWIMMMVAKHFWTAAKSTTGS